jgi:hypothetical protein
MLRALATAVLAVRQLRLVKEDVTWFSEAGKPWHTARVSAGDR